jgi:hypothetical protein
LSKTLQVICRATNKAEPARSKGFRHSKKKKKDRNIKKNSFMKRTFVSLLMGF